MLREEGLAGDRLGDAMAFFELSDRQAHRLFCDCHYSGSMTGAGLALRLRMLAQRRHSRVVRMTPKAARLNEAGGLF